MSQVTFGNYASTTIANVSGITASVTQVTLASVATFPTLSASNWMYLVITRLSDNAAEIVKVTQLVTATKVATITRASGGTTALAFSCGDRIELMLVSDDLDDLRSQWKADITASLAQTITRGSVVVGGVSAVPTERALATGKVLGGNGTDAIALGLSGDATWAVSGTNLVLTLAADAVKVACDGVGLELSAGGALRLKDLGVTTAKLGAASVTSEKISATVIQYAAVEINYLAVRSLYATPVTLVPAQGAGMLIVPLDTQLVLNAGVAYPSHKPVLRYGGTAGAACSDDSYTNFFNSATDKVQGLESGGIAMDPNACDLPVVLHCSGSLAGSGTGKVYAYIWYRVIALSF